MPLKFDLLPDLLLERIFKLSDPFELFKYRFLSKYLFGIVSRVIKYNLTFSVYNQEGFDKYWYYQLKFIKENGQLMRHININSTIINYLNYCPNIKSIEYVTTPGNEIDMKFESLELELSRLKKLILKLSNFPSLLNIFLGSLNQVEVFEYEGVIYLLEILLDI
ncbi:hypothetical protein K502DRAFT_346132 [Neoconidiobolus thromboides FSU 785]|nr:hypothetical protein K502DRAFT_346132 [Neoconidiobolus thromboides FSU 785]